MRPIEFRAWDQDGECFSYSNKPDAHYIWGFDELGTLKCWYCDMIIPSDLMEAPYPDSIEICKPEQYIGLRDGKRTKEFPNGQPIYEGDILECSMSFEGGTLPHMGEIVWDNTFGAYGTKNEAGITLLHHHCLRTLNVIGNVHDKEEEK